MATGDVPDIQARLRTLLPPWFPSSGQAPVIDGVLTGIAWLLSYIYGLIQYARAQSRIATATGAWLDLIAWDYFGARLGRQPGELDPALSARIRQELIRRRVTRSAIQTALQGLTGYPVRIIEPARPTDVGFYKVRGSGIEPISFWNVDTPSCPLRWSGRGVRGQFFIECVLPLVSTLGNNALPAWGEYTINWMLRGTAGARASANSLLERGGLTTASGAATVYSLINAMRAAGVIAWVRFVPIPTEPYWDEPGATWDASGARYDTPGQGPIWP